MCRSFFADSFSMSLILRRFFWLSLIFRRFILYVAHTSAISFIFHFNINSKFDQPFFQLSDWKWEQESNKKFYSSISLNLTDFGFSKCLELGLIKDFWEVEEGHGKSSIEENITQEPEISKSPSKPLKKTESDILSICQNKPKIGGLVLLLDTFTKDELNSLEVISFYS